MLFKKYSFIYRYIFRIIYLLVIMLYIISLPSFAENFLCPDNQSEIPEEAIILNEQTIREISYCSHDREIFIFRHITPQLENLRPGNIIVFNQYCCEKLYLGKITGIIREKDHHQAMILETNSWKKNDTPVISSIIARPAIVLCGKTIELTCHAADQDGDMLSYYWFGPQKKLIGYKPYIRWNAPEKPGHYQISCEVRDNQGNRDSHSIQVSVIKNIPELTDLERELIQRYGWGNNRIIHWPEGKIGVYDETEFWRMGDVLEQWNEIIGGKTVFYLSSNPLSPVHVKYDKDLGKRDLCGHIDTQWRNYELNKAGMTINPDEYFCGFPQDRYPLYLHLFSGIVGFNDWQGELIERENWRNFYYISDIMKLMIQALYRIPNGYDLNKIEDS